MTVAILVVLAAAMALARRAGHALSRHAARHQETSSVTRNPRSTTMRSTNAAATACSGVPMPSWVSVRRARRRQALLRNPALDEGLGDVRTCGWPCVLVMDLLMFDAAIAGVPPRSR